MAHQIPIDLAATLSAAVEKLDEAVPHLQLAHDYLGDDRVLLALLAVPCLSSTLRAHVAVLQDSPDRSFPSFQDLPSR